MSALKRWFPVVARILLGLPFFVFGLNGFIHFIPDQPIPGPAGVFVGAIVGSGYLFQLLKAFEVFAGALLLIGRWVPFALTLLAPILINILAFHIVLAPSGVVIAIVLVALEIALAWTWRDAFAPLFRHRLPRE